MLIGLIYSLKMYKFSLSYLLFTLTSVQALTLVHTVPDNNVFRNPPEITLSGYKEADSVKGTLADNRFLFQSNFGNDFVSKRGSDYLIYSDTTQVAFTCEAEYPITWIFPFPNQLPKQSYIQVKSEEQRISELLPEFSQPVNIRFKTQILITLTSLEFLSLNMTCVSVNMKPEHQSSIHIFLQGRQSLEHQGQTLTPTEDELINDDSLVLPCRPSSPNMTVGLEWKSSKYFEIIGQPPPQNRWQPFESFDYETHFNPKTGFTLKRNRQSTVQSQLSGLFRCFVKTNDPSSEDVTSRNYVYINVTVSKASGFMFHVNTDAKSILHGKASFSVSEISIVSDFICCSGVPEKPPRLEIAHCSCPLQCKLLQQSASHGGFENAFITNLNDKLFSKLGYNTTSDCVSNILAGTSQIVKCQGDNIDFFGMYVNSFNPLVQGTVAGRPERFKPGTGHQLGLLNLYSLTQYTNLEKVIAKTQKMAIFLGKFVHKRRKSKAKASLNSTNLSLSVNFPKKQTLPFDNDNNAVIASLSFNDLLLLAARVERQSYQISEYAKDVYYEGEPLVVFCVAVKYFYASGAHLMLNWKNGTKTKLGNADNPTVSRLSKKRKIVYLSNGADMFSGIGKDAQSIFGQPIQAKPEMTSVDCWMPLIESNKWDKLSKPIKVLQSVAPRFLEPEEETVNVYLGNEGNYLLCTIVEARPFPSLTVLWDGKNVQLNWDAKILKQAQEQADIPTGTETVNRQGNFINLKINFDRIQHAHHSTIQCIANNVNKTVTRTVHVIVMEKPSLAHPIVLSIAGILSIVLVGLALKHWRDKVAINTIKH